MSKPKECPMCGSNQIGECMSTYRIEFEGVRIEDANCRYYYCNECEAHIHPEKNVLKFRWLKQAFIDLRENGVELL